MKTEEEIRKEIKDCEDSIEKYGYWDTSVERRRIITLKWVLGEE